MAEVSITAGQREGIAPHIPALDGIRAISITAVLATHLIPIYAFGKHFNTSVGIFGMSLFFILSGFLVTTQGLKLPSVWTFARRRLLRIVPVAWLCILVTSIFSKNIDGQATIRYLFFSANIPPQTLQGPLEHFWSLCVEMHFYLFACVLLLFRSVKIWMLLPLLLLTATGIRIYFHVDGTSITLYRIDDILAGATLVILLNNKPNIVECKQATANIIFAASLILFILGSLHEPYIGENWFSYMRPYSAALMVCMLIIKPNTYIEKCLSHPYLKYLATISYALYIWHLPLAATWLGSGDIFEKYAKRPLLLLTLFFSAHVSTFYFEKIFNSKRKTT